jgi:predicted small lipoprotein YifL
MLKILFVISLFAFVACGIKGKPVPPVEATKQEAEKKPEAKKVK